MGPRKRSRPNPKVVESTQGVPPASQPENQTSTDSRDLAEHVVIAPKLNGTGSNPNNQSRSGWYAGTWPRKSTPSTQVARESILADKSQTPVPSVDLSRFEPKKPESQPAQQPAQLPAQHAARPASMNIGKGQETTDTFLRGTDTLVDDLNPRGAQPSVGDTGHEVTKPFQATAVSQERADTSAGFAGPTLKETQRPSTSSGWLGWFGTQNLESMPPSSDPVQGPSISPPSSKPDEEPPSQPETEPPQPSLQVVSTSWFNIWPSTNSGATVTKSGLSGLSSSAKEGLPTAEVSGGNTELPELDNHSEPAPGSSWAFWSRDTSKGSENKDGRKEYIASSEQGTLAIAGEPSQDHPEPAHAPVVKNVKNKIKSSKSQGETLQADDASSTKTSVLDQSSKSQDANSSKALPPNLLLPTFRSTYRLKDNPSILQQLARLIMHSQQSPTKHVFLIKEPPKIKRALAIGVHGLFPAALLRTVIGQPTGTSVRFANHAASAIHRWADQHGCECEIEKVALEGEGKIAERVDNLWKLLLNWIDHVRNADFVLIACHSQGVPVALMLVAKLIEFGVVTTAKIGVCAMAGVSLGPFSDYKSRFFSGSAAELFEFANPESEVSKRYEDSLRIALNYGVRVTYVGSIDDQLVSLESAIFSSVNHPYIYRSVFVDGRVHAPDFIAHLVGFALKLRNLGVSDHGLIRELSAPLAGSLYTGGGHSSLYDETRIYDLAVEFTLETSSVSDVPLRIQKYEVPTTSNPFQLPWSMRGLLEEDVVKTELDQETTELLMQFDQWKPTSKVLKDVKYRLEAVKSKL